MGVVKLPAPVCLILAVTYRHTQDAQEALALFVAEAGPVAMAGNPFQFDHTHYYEQEMGTCLTKGFYAFQELIDPAQLVKYKLLSNRIEQDFIVQEKRRVNLDPGYLEAAKLVLATTKNFGHRIYLNDGIYGDVQLFWRKGQFQCNPWTYPDYQDPRSLSFFTLVRENYMKNRGEIPWQSPTSHLA